MRGCVRHSPTWGSAGLCGQKLDELGMLSTLLSSIQRIVDYLLSADTVLN